VDAIIRKIDSARLEREARADLEHADKATLPDASGVGLTDTVVFQTPVVALDEARRERERILAPGADGAAGAPYKMLRTQVMRRLTELNANTLAVMSASNGDGKTLTAINLAIAIAAQPGYTALLVDLDLRNPNIHRRFGIEPKVGVEECLEQDRAIYEAMVKIEGYDRLSVLPARTAVAHSSELLASKYTGEVVQELRTRYFNRVLIFDLPPVLMTDDALAFSEHVQAGLLVVAEGKTARDEVMRSLMLLHKLAIVGTVLNGSRQSTGAYY
jgi:capsular exopolysaccharide synthesis family protein